MMSEGVEAVGVVVRDILSRRQLLRPIPLGSWEDVVGPQIAARAQPIRLSKGLLVIHAYDSVWKHHLEFLKDEIAAKVNARAQADLVTRVVIKVGEIPAEEGRQELLEGEGSTKRAGKPKGPPHRRKKRVERYDLSESARHLVKTIRDPELRTLARKLLSLFPP